MRVHILLITDLLTLSMISLFKMKNNLITFLKVDIESVDCTLSLLIYSLTGNDTVWTSANLSEHCINSKPIAGHIILLLLHLSKGYHLMVIPLQGMLAFSVTSVDIALHIHLVYCSILQGERDLCVWPTHPILIGQIQIPSNI